jgi:hypothetical protein
VGAGHVSSHFQVPSFLPLQLFLIAGHTHHRICLGEDFSQYSGGKLKEGAYHRHGKIFFLQGWLLGSGGISLPLSSGCI